MAPLPPGVDPEIFDDLLTVEDGRRLFEALGRPFDFWEALCLVKEDRALLREEVRRLTELARQGRAAGIARAILEKRRLIQDRLGFLAKELYKFIPLVPGAPTDRGLVELMVAFIIVSPKGRESASRWIADPARFVREATDRLKAIEVVVDNYRRALRAARPAPVRPAGESLESAVFETDEHMEPAAFEPLAGVEAPVRDPFRSSAAPVAEAPPPAAPSATGETMTVPIPEPSEAPPSETDVDPVSEFTEVEEFPVPAEPPASPPPAPPAPPPPPVSAAPAAPAAPALPVELPAGVDPDVLDDVRRVEECRKIFEVTHQQIEVWEVFCLVVSDREATRATMEGLLKLKNDGQTELFTEGALALFEKLLDVRAKNGRFVRQLREYVGKLQVGTFGKETMEMALGFIVASAKGRAKTQQWLDAPDRFKAEASGRLEDVISKTMKYQTALRMMSKS